MEGDNEEEDSDCSGSLAAVIIDNGSASIKAGIAGNIDGPKCNFPSYVARPHEQSVIRSSWKSVYVGEKPQNTQEVWRVKYPIEKGVINHWEDMEEIWRETYKRLGVNPEKHPVLLTEPPLNPKQNREKLTQIMMEQFNVPAMNLALQPVLSLYSTGRTTGVVVDVGENITYITPVHEGYIYEGNMYDSITRYDVGGQDLTQSMINMLQSRGYSFSTFHEREMIAELKHKMAYVALDYEKEFEKFSSTNCEKTFELPDGREVTLGTEQFRCAEAIFKPWLLPNKDHGGGGLHDALFRIITKSVDIEKDLYANIVLAGGTTMFPGIDERLKKEMQSYSKCIFVVAPPQRIYSTWIGGSMLAALLRNRMESWVTREDYEETGPSIIHRKCC